MATKRQENIYRIREVNEMHVYQDNNGTVCFSDRELASGRMRHLGEANTEEEFMELFKGEEGYISTAYADVVKSVFGGLNFKKS